MSEVTTITTKGQVTIPQAVRETLKAQIGDKVSFAKLLPKTREVIIKIISTDIVNELSGSLSTKVKETNFKKARNKAGKLLAKKYQI